MTIAINVNIKLLYKYRLFGHLALLEQSARTFNCLIRFIYLLPVHAQYAIVTSSFLCVTFRPIFVLLPRVLWFILSDNR